MKQFLSIGECMLELSEAGDDLWTMGVAGDTLNTAWYARRALADDWQVDYLTRIGTDRFSDRIAGFLTAEGIGTGHVQRDPDRGAGLYAISLTEGERSFTYWRGQSAARHLADDEAALAGALRGAGVVYFTGITLAILAPDRREVLLRAALSAKAKGAMVAFDPNIRPKLWESPHAARNWIMRAAGAASILLPSFDDEAASFGDATPEATAARYREVGAGEVVVKNGGGEMLIAASEVLRIGDLARVRPVDSTGAGDSFNAAYLAARLGGAGPAEAARRGHDLASRVVLAKGALMR